MSQTVLIGKGQHLKLWIDLATGTPRCLALLGKQLLFTWTSHRHGIRRRVSDIAVNLSQENMMEKGG